MAERKMGGQKGARERGAAWLVRAGELGLVDNLQAILVLGQALAQASTSSRKLLAVPLIS